MNIAIVGVGLVGRVLALNLLKEGHTLTLFDKSSKEGTDAAGFTAAGKLQSLLYLSMENARWNCGVTCLKRPVYMMVYS
jgi:2-polyprenyl-6-methoxyphenol hydroxylase-like FAD-dependent oxidoreductase